MFLSYYDGLSTLSLYSIFLSLDLGEYGRDLGCIRAHTSGINRQGIDLGCLDLVLLLVLVR